MKHSGRRSSSLQRAQSRSGSTRRLSDAHEKPAWDATSSDLDKFKLTAEELERRKAARTSRNRPFATDVKRSFVEAWAKNVTASVIRPDIEHDQDRPRSSPPAGALPINYGSVVKMLRRSPAAASRTSSMASRHVPELQTQPGSAGGGSQAGTPIPLAPDGSTSAAEVTGVASIASGLPKKRSMGGVYSTEAPEAAAGAKPGELAKQPAVGTTQGEDHFARMGAANSGTTRTPGLHRAEISNTPDMLRPRYNPADATTIISYDEDSDNEDQQDGYGAMGGSPDAGVGTSDRADPMTTAFEAALFGRPPQARVGDVAAVAAPWAWASKRSTSSPIGTAASEVEQRLRALEEALAVAGPRGDSLVPEELAELRAELRTVRQDNVQLRQELSAFSSHASALLTQLQAQVQQLLRPSASGATGMSSLAAQPSSSYPRPSQPQQPFSEAGPTLPTYTAAADNAPMVGAMGVYATRAQVPSQQPLQVTMATALPVVRRNIFADLDVSALRPAVSAIGASGAGVQPPVPSVSPYSAHGGVSSRAVPMTTVPTSTAPYAPHPVHVSNIDDADVALPSFAAFRRSAGAAAFTAARPLASVPLVSPTALGAAYSGELGPAVTDASPQSATAAVQPRSFPTQYQPRSLGGVLVRAGPGAAPTVSLGAAYASAMGTSAAATGAGAPASLSTYTGSLVTSAAAAATGSGAASASLAREHSGLPQPLMFSMGPEYRTARASGLSAENSMSLSAHTAAAAGTRAKASRPVAFSGPGR